MLSQKRFLQIAVLVISVSAIKAICLPPQNFSSVKDLATALVNTKTEEDRELLLQLNDSLIGIDLRKELMSQGDQMKAESNYPAAIATYELVLKIASTTNDQEGIALAYSGIGGVHFWQAHYPKSLEYFEKTIAIYKSLEDKNGIAQTEKRMGFVHYYMADYQVADELLQSALRQFQASDDLAAVGSTLNAIGLIAQAEGDGESAEQLYKESMKISESIKDYENFAAAQNNLGNLYYDWADFSTSLNYYQKGLRFDEEQGRKWGIAADLGNIGGVHLKQGNYDLAIEYFQKSLAIRKSLGDEVGVANTYINIGEANWFQDKHELALQFLDRAGKLFEKLQLKEGLAVVTLEMSDANSSQQNYNEAVELGKKALSIFEEIGQVPRVAEALNGLAGANYGLGNFDEAIQYASRSAQIAEERNLQDTLWKAKTNLGLAYLSSGKLEEASISFQNAIDTIEHLRSMVAGQEQEQQIFLQERIEPYYAMIGLLQSQNKDSEALAFAERAKARVLMDVLQTGRTNITRAMSIEEQQQERQFRSNLAALNLKLTQEAQSDQPDQKRISGLQSQLQKARMDFEAYQATLYTAHPELKIQRGEPEDLNLQKARTLLSNGQTAFLEYVVSKEKTFLFIVTSSNMQTYEIKTSEEHLRKTVRAYRDQIAKRDPAFRSTAKQLYKLLVLPAVSQLSEIQNTIIIPDGTLWELPFQALISEKDRFLLEDLSISYAPSIAALTEMKKLHDMNSSNPNVLGFANPTFGKETTEKVQTVFRGLQLHSLPEAEVEIKKLKELYGSDQTSIYFGRDARESVLKQEIGKYEVIHLATHGILNETNPMYSYLLFSRSGSNDPEDGLLEAWEIMKMNLKASLVILSACETARGRVGAGEGMIGLNWAFFVAGCPTTVVSQWKVESTSTANFMFGFHRNLKNGMPRSQALRQAALSIMKQPDYRHPFYWASFILVGVPS